MSLLTVAEVAAELRLSNRIVYRLINSKALRAINVGSGEKKPNWIVKRCDLDSFLDCRANDTQPVPVRKRVNKRPILEEIV